MRSAHLFGLSSLCALRLCGGSVWFRDETWPPCQALKLESLIYEHRDGPMVSQNHEKAFKRDDILPSCASPEQVDDATHVVSGRAMERELGGFSRLHGIRCRSQGERARSPRQNLPSTAICCQTVAVKPLRLLQCVTTSLAHRGRAGQPGPQAENRERGCEEPRCQAATEGQFVP